MKALLAWQIRIAQVAQKKLSERQLIEFNEALRRPPRNFGLNTNIWDSKTLSSIIKQQYNIDLGVRQFQQLIRRLGFRLRKQRPVIAKADPARQKEHKKNSAKW
jgi:transposase